MVFPSLSALTGLQIPQPPSNPPSESTAQPTTNLDSITLGQLKSIVGTSPKPKQSYYDFRYEDEDTMFNEIEEFYSYVEAPQIAENLKAWNGSFEGDWIKAPIAKRKVHVEVILESLEHRDPEIRFTNARRLLYIIQGVFAETTSPEHQSYWILQNCKLVRSCNGVGTVVEAMKIASAKHDLLSNLSDQDAQDLNISAADKADFVEEINTELSMYLGMLYFLIEVLKGDHDFSEELMNLEPPLPVYLFNVVSGLKDKSAKGYPVKKLLLVLWKSLLACCGGIRELGRVKKLSRELNGLPPVPENTKMPVKSTPMDIEFFRQETSVKYPTFNPAIQSKVLDGLPPSATSKIAEAYAPIPVRPHYHHQDPSSALLSNAQKQQPQQSQPFQQRPPNLPTTPAPSPPPTPKLKKQQFQTDQTRPFLFPFSTRATGRNGKMIPFAIDEADRLYSNHMHLSVALWQMWRVREDCILDESGLADSSFAQPRRKSEHVDKDSSLAALLSDRRYSTVPFANTDPDEEGEILPDLILLDQKIAEAEDMIKAADQNDDRSARSKARERRDDLIRLKRVETIYSAVLPTMSGWVLVLLKLLLATVTAAGGSLQNPQSATSSNFPPGVPPDPQQPPPPPLTFEEIDVIRHREITSKAVSAILLLTLKWFKVSHIMKFHHLGQLLLDSNCLLLVLKMFGLQEVSTTVVTKADSPDHNFFRYCQLNFARNPQILRPEDNMPNPTKRTISRTVQYPNGQKGEEEVEMLSEFSWRNFFSSINFVKIMQKLSKQRSHRIWLLVQYKSSAILKRILKVSHPLLQLHVLKLIKSQVPFCGRKWRQSNMKVITQIYMNCRPDLRDEWLTGTEVDDLGDALAQEQALRGLVKFYNTKRYGKTGHAPPFGHQRTTSQSMPGLEGLHAGPELANIHRPSGTPNIDIDVFPPLRSQAPDPSIFLKYIPEDIAFEEEYEEWLSDLGIFDGQTGSRDHASANNVNPYGSKAWSRFVELPNVADTISDSESVASIGDLGEEIRGEDSSDKDSDVVDENRNNWVHMSPKTMAALPKSPAGNRRSSSGSQLRPVLPFDLDDGSALDDDPDPEEPEMGPMPRAGTSFAAAEGGKGVDEVEFMYNE
ncbi:hypothetical protein SISNIDRAFT_423128 [Sistotremastrum niveocremeum HHB9708]|uniref:N1221-domain-containing protein n=1 Tax=Sistotremastrum niveocremeum HHB9708 TaxID=1314777 RepID=A0A164ZIK1_9AGAM|nr:hypothetical protein SISNIDRAFT_423128 [Sistotremastrum niveocremeum HHB9708]